MADNRTPIRHLRIPDPIWEPAKARAEAEGITISEAARNLLRDYGQAAK